MSIQPNKETIHQTLQLYCSYNKCVQTKKERLSTDLFLLKTSKGMNFVAKNSIKGRWLLLKSGKTKKSASFQEEIKEAQAILAKAKQVDRSSFATCWYAEGIEEAITYERFQTYVNTIQQALNEIDQQIDQTLKQKKIEKLKEPSACHDAALLSSSLWSKGLKELMKQSNQKQNGKKGGNPSLYGPSSKELLIASLDLLHSYDRAADHRNREPDELKVHTLYLVAHGNRLLFKQKKGLKGRLEKLLASARKLLGKKDKRLDLHANLQQAACILQKAAEDEKFLIQLADELSSAQKQEVTPQLLQKELERLCSLLNSLRQHVVDKQTLKGRATADLSKAFALKTSVSKIKTASAPPFEEAAAYKKHAEEKLAQLFSSDDPSQKENIIKEICCLLFTHAERTAILEELPDKTDRLQRAVIEAIAAMPSERGEPLHNALKQLMPPPSETRSLSLKTIAVALGDKFIKDSGLEGDLNTRDYAISISEYFQEEYLQEPALCTPLAKSMDHAARNIINLIESDLSGKQLRDKIKDNLKEQPGSPKSCLLMGGWQGHAIIYEIELQRNGRYTFRVFNRGEGSNDHRQFIDKYGLQSAGSIEIKDIKASHLMRSSFLESLCTLCWSFSQGEAGVEPWNLLVFYILPHLHGRHTEANPRTQKILSLQESGTCTNACLEAWAADKMAARDYARFSVDYKRYLLRRHQPQLHQAAESAIINSSEYDEKRLHYQVIKRAAEELASTLHNQQGVVPDSTVNSVQKTLLETQVLLKQLEARLIGYERLQSATLNRCGKIADFDPFLKKCPYQDFSCDEEKLSVENRFTPHNYHRLIETIDQLQGPEDGKTVAECLDLLAGLTHLISISKVEKTALCLAFLKKLGGVKSWDSIKFDEPERSLSDLGYLLEQIREHFIAADAPLQPHTYLAYLLLGYGYECAYSQLPADLRVLSEPHNPSILSLPEVASHLLTLPTTDPYFTSLAKEMAMLAEAQANKASNHPLAKVDLVQPEPFKLNKNFVDAIEAWWQSPKNEALRKQVADSISQDRIEQKNVIEELKTKYTNQQRLLKEQIAGKKKELDTLHDNCKKLPKYLFTDDKRVANPAIQKVKKNIDSLQNEIIGLQKEVDESDAIINNAEHHVKNNARFWPQGFLKEEGGVLLTPEERAAFLLADAIGEDGSFFTKKLYMDMMPHLKDYISFICHSKHLLQVKDGITEKNPVKFKFKTDKYNRIENKKELEYEKDEYLNENHLKIDLFIETLKLNGAEGGVKYLESIQANLEEQSVPAAALKSKVKSPHAELKELLSLKSDRSMQLYSTLAYFFEHRQQLKQRPYIDLFSALMLDTQLLSAQLSEPKGAEQLASHLHQFFDTTIKEAIKLGNIEMAANMLWIASCLQRYVDDANRNRTLAGQEALPDVLDGQLRFELFEKAMASEHKPHWGVAAEALLASLQPLFEKTPLFKTETITEKQQKEAGLAIAALVLMKKSLVCQESFILPRYEQAQMASMMINTCFLKLLKLEKNQEARENSERQITNVINTHTLELIKKIYPSLTAQNFAYHQLFVWQGDDGTYLNPSNGELAIKSDQLASSGNQLTPLIKEQLISSLLYRHENEMMHLCYHQDQKGLFVYDSLRKLTICIGNDEKTFYLKKDGEQQWVNLIVKDKEHYLPDNHLLLNNYHLISTPEAAFLCDKESLEPVFTLKKGIFKEVQGKQLKLAKVHDFLMELPNMFSTFEDTRCTLFWAKNKPKYEGVLEEIDFPRLGISLHCDAQDNWQWGQRPGWKLSKEQYAPGLPQRNDGVRHLVFEDGQKNQRVVIPLWDLKEYKPKENHAFSVDNLLKKHEKKNSLAARYEYDFKAETEQNGSYIECDITDGKLMPTTLLARYYLARLYLEQGHTERAEELLFALEAEESTQPLSDQQRRQLLLCAAEPFSKEIGSRTCMLRMRALTLLAKNSALFNPEEEKLQQMKGVTRLKAIKELYSLYLKRLPDLRPLKPADELAIFTLYPELEKEPHLFCRQNELKIGHEQPLASLIENPLKDMKRPQLEFNPFEAPRHRQQYDPQFPFLSKKRFLERFIVSKRPSLQSSFDSAHEKAEDFMISLHRMIYGKDRLVFDHSIDRYKPTLKDRLQYRRCRLQNSFPFDPLQVDADQFQHYYALMKKESRWTFRWQAASRGNLLQTLYLMALFNPDEEVKKRSADLLRKLSSASFLFSAMEPKMPSYREKKALYVEELLPQKIQQDIASLAPLGDVIEASTRQQLPMLFGANVEESSQTLEQIALHFTAEEQLTRPQASLGEAIFDLRHPEIYDKAAQAEAKRLCDDLKSVNLSTIGYKLDEAVDAIEVEDNIKRYLEEKALQLSSCEYVIVNSVQAALQACPAASLEQSARKMALPSIEELCLLCATPHFKEHIKRHYPLFDDEAAARLHCAVREYLTVKLLVQRAQRAAHACREMVEAQKNIKALQRAAALNAHPQKKRAVQEQLQTAQEALERSTNSLAKTLREKSCYDLNDDPYSLVYMLIEAALNITLRQKQAEGVRGLAEGVSEGKEQVLQLLMGEGKTAVMQPLIAFYLTLLQPLDEKKLSCVAVPEALATEVVDELKKKLGRAFQQRVLYMPYDRKKAKELAHLQTYLNRLEEAKKEGQCLFFTPRQQHSIVTSLYESYYELKDDPSNIDLRARNRLIAKIVEFLKKEALIQIDEIDMITNPETIFKYTLGSKQIVDRESVSLLSDLLLDLAEDQSLSSAISIDFIEAYQKRCKTYAEGKKSPINADLYETYVKDKLTGRALHKLQQKSPQLKALIDEEPEMMRHFLMQTTPHDQQRQCYDLIIAKLKKNDDRQLLSCCAYAISTVFSSSLLKECGARYGLDQNNQRFVSRPYEAPNAPKETMHADPYTQAIYTIQQTLFYGIPKEGAKKMLLDLQTQAARQMRSRLPLEQTPAYNTYRQIMADKADAFNLMAAAFSDDFIDAFKQQASASKEAVKLFIDTMVCPQIAYYEKELSSTPQTIKGLSKTAAGYSGTPDEGALPRGMKLIKTEGTDGKTIAAVRKKIVEGQADVRVLKTEPNKSYARQMADIIAEDEKLHLFIDSAGWLKEEKMEEYAKVLLEKCEESQKRAGIKGIVYHDSEKRIVSLERDSKGAWVVVPFAASTLQPQERITIIQKRYETGTNVLQPPSCHVQLSLGKAMEGDRLRQAMFRARELLANQKLSITMNEEVKEQIATDVSKGILQTPGFEALLNQNRAPQRLDEQTIDELINSLDLPEGSEKLKIALKETLQEYDREGHLTDVLEGKSPQNKAALAFSELFARRFSVDIDAIWRNSALQQARVRQKRAWLAGVQRMREVVEEPIRMALSDSRLSLDERLAIFKAAEKLIVSGSQNSLFEKMNQEKRTLPAADAIAERVEHFSSIFNEVLSKNPLHQGLFEEYLNILYGKEPLNGPTAADRIRQELQKCIDPDRVAEMVELGQTDCDEEAELELETEEEQEQEQEQEQEAVLEHPAFLAEKFFSPMVEQIDKAYVIDQLFDSQKKVCFADKLPEGMLLPSGRSLEASANWYLSEGEVGSAPYGEYLLPARYMVVLNHKEKGVRSILLSSRDANLIKNSLYKGQLKKAQAALITLDGFTIAGEPSLIEDEQVRRACVECKLLTGKTNYSTAELELLEKSLLAMKGCELGRTIAGLEKLHLDVLKYNPAAYGLYEGSLLQKMFTKLKSTT